MSFTGIEVSEFDSLYPGTKVRVLGRTGEAYASFWCDIIDEKETEVLARYEDDYYTGKTAITKNSFGKGSVYYIGCDLDEDGMNNLVSYILNELGIGSFITTESRGVEITKKIKENIEYYFILNHNDHTVTITIKKQMRDMITGNIFSEFFKLPGYGVCMLSEL